MINQKLLDTIYDTADRLMRYGQFTELDARLRNLNVRNMNEEEILGWLTATLPAKSKLKERPEFYKYAFEVIWDRGGRSFPELEELFKGLE